MAIRSITVQELAALRQQGRALDLLDVRTPEEYAQVHAEGARLVALQALTSEAAQANRGAPTEPLYVICRSGGRSQQACQRLAAAGLDVVNVVGGTEAWIAAGLPVVRGSGITPTEGGGALRRSSFRLAAMLLILVSLLLGWLVHPSFTALAFAGWLGLILTGGCCCGDACALPPRPPQSPAHRA